MLLRTVAPVLALAVLALPSVAQHALIIDAGSTGSRIRMYSKQGRGLAEVVAVSATVEVEPGISSYQAAPASAGPSLKVLLDTAAQFLPATEHSSTPLWVKATAGLRLVPPDQLDGLFGALETYLASPSNCPFKFMGAEVLGGEEEAVFAWISMNSILGTIFEEEHTHGILDLGGASSQIAFQPSTDIMSNEFAFYIDGMRRSVYAKSFIRFGVSEAVTRAKEAAALGAGEGEVVDFPCFNKDFSEQTEVAGRAVTFRGTGDPDACLLLVRSLLGLAVECLLPPCAMMGTHMSPVPLDMKFYGIASYFHVVNGLGLMGSSPAKTLSPSEILAAARRFCETPMAEAQAASAVPWKYNKYNGCFGGLYVYSNLIEYGFKGGDTSITFLNKLDGKSADWSLGAALYETQYMPVLLPTRLQPAAVGVSAFTVACTPHWAWAFAAGAALGGPLALGIYCLAGAARAPPRANQVALTPQD